MTHNQIDRFDGEHAFLSNFHAVPVRFEGITFPTTEHAFQAAKTTDPASRVRIAKAATPGAAKRLGRTVELRPDWGGMRIGVMEQICRIKFKDDVLAAKLAATGDSELVEGNTWNDTFWGVCKGKGRNHLGAILMKIRDES